MPIDCGFDEIGSKESQRYCHVDFAHAACGAGGDALGRGRRILDQLLEPTAPLRNRSNQCRFRLRPDGTRTLLRWVSRQKNFATPGLAQTRTGALAQSQQSASLSCQSEWDAGAAAMGQRAEEFRIALWVAFWSKECGECLRRLVRCRLQLRFGSI